MMTPVAFAGIDTHADFHHVAVIDADGHPITDQAFPTTTDGYLHLERFLAQHPGLAGIGIEGSSSYGAAITHLLHAAGHRIVEVNRPDREQRRRDGKSDPADAVNAAQAVRTKRATTPPKLTTGHLEDIRLTMIVRSSAVKAKTQCINEIWAIIRTAPAALADQLKGLTLHKLIAVCTRFRPDQTQDPTLAAGKATLQILARRWTYLHTEANTAEHHLDTLLNTIAPELLALDSVGTITAAQFLITAGNNPDRLHSEAAFARLIGVAPIPASSGKTQRHRLHRGGDRQANHAAWRVIFNRTRRHPATQAYIQRRRAEQLTDREILRCLKRYLVREIFPILTTIINREHNPQTT